MVQAKASFEIQTVLLLGLRMSYGVDTKFYLPMQYVYIVDYQ